MLHGQLSATVLDVPRNLHVKFHQNQVNNSCDIADLKVPFGGGGGGRWCVNLF